METVQTKSINLTDRFAKIGKISAKTEIKINKYQIFVNSFTKGIIFDF